jgi:hypothetical protein
MCVATAARRDAQLRQATLLAENKERASPPFVDSTVLTCNHSLVVAFIIRNEVEAIWIYSEKGEILLLIPDELDGEQQVSASVVDPGKSCWLLC